MMMTVVVKMPSPRKVFDAGTQRWAEKAYRKLPKDSESLPPYLDAATLHLMPRMEEAALFLERMGNYSRGLAINNGTKKVRTFIFDDYINDYIVLRGRLVDAARGLPDWFKFVQMCVIEDGS
jgi:hypothetical protein